MPKQTPLISDFAFGELTPKLLGRSDEPIYYKGAATMQNVMPLRQGGFTKRPGTVYQGQTNGNNAANIVSWAISATLAYVVEFSLNKIRFWKYSSNPDALTYLGTQDITTTYTLADCFSLTFGYYFPYLFVTQANHPPFMITWHSGDTFTSQNIPFSGTSPNISPTNTFMSLIGTISGTTTVTLTTGALNPDIPGGTTYNNYVGQAVTAAGVPTGTTISAVTSSTVFTLSQAATNNTGVVLTLSWPYIDGQASPALPFQSSGNYPDICCVAFQRLWFGASTNQPLSIWASMIGIFDTNLNVQMGTYEQVQYQSSTMVVDSNGNPTTTPPTYTSSWVLHQIVNDDDGVNITLNSDKNDQIMFITPDVDLFVGTATAQWVISAAATANSITANLVSRIGSASNGLNAAMTQGGCVFIGQYGRGVNQISWQGLQNPWVPPEDLSFFSEHLFRNFYVTNWDFQGNPETYLWFVRNDGQICVLLLDTVHQVRGWWRFMTTGAVQSVCVIPDGNRDIVVMSVTRNTTFNTLEIFADPDWYNTTLTNSGELNAHYVDSGFVYSGVAAGVFATALPHLVGLTVQCVANGAYVGTAIVAAGGSVTLPNGITATSVHLGLQFTALFQTMPINVISQTGASVGSMNIAPFVTIRYLNALDGAWGPDTGHLQTAALAEYGP